MHLGISLIQNTDSTNNIQKYLTLTLLSFVSLPTNINLNLDKTEYTFTDRLIYNINIHLPSSNLYNLLVMLRIFLIFAECLAWAFQIK